MVSLVEGFRRVASTPDGAARRAAWGAYEADNREVLCFYDSQYGSAADRASMLLAAGRLLPDLAQRESLVRAELQSAHRELLNSGLLAAEVPLVAVLMVGGGSSNAWVDLFGGRPTIFVALEMMDDSINVPVLLRHELVHIAHIASLWDQLAGTPQVADQAVFRVWAEGLAVAGSRQLMPGQPQEDYFFETNTWLGRCQHTAPMLLDEVLTAGTSTDPAAAARFCAVDSTQPWPSRAGYWLGDLAVTEQLRRGADLASLLHWGPGRALAAFQQLQLPV